MRKSLVICGVAALALASCTQSEVLEVNDSRAIGFDAFVNNNTRAAAAELNKDGLTQFNVFGYHGEDTPDYTNTLVTGSGQTNTWTIATAYWQANQAYEFAAYSDGNNSIENDKVSFANKNLTITGYTVGSNDLIAAQTSVAPETDIANYDIVGLSFYHLLSQVKFTFSNSDSRDYVMNISDLKITANKTGKVVFTMTNSTTPSITWSEATPGDYTITGLVDIAEGYLNAPHSTESIMIMPQENDNLSVSFNVTLSDKNNGEIAKGNFTAPLDIDAAATNSAWKPGYRYNYTATINGDQVPDIDDPDKKPIKINFSVSEVKGWENAEDDKTTPSVVEPKP